MKLKFKMTGKAPQKATVTVVLESPRGDLTRDEMRTWKAKFQDRVHAVLREDGYSVASIKIAQS